MSSRDRLLPPLGDDPERTYRLGIMGGTIGNGIPSGKTSYFILQKRDDTYQRSVCDNQKACHTYNSC